MSERLHCMHFFHQKPQHRSDLSSKTDWIFVYLINPRLLSWKVAMHLNMNIVNIAHLTGLFKFLKVLFQLYFKTADIDLFIIALIWKTLSTD